MKKEKVKKSKGNKKKSLISKDQERYKNCSICCTIPDSSNEFWVGGELRTAPLPASTKHLEIIGAPFYDDSTSYSHTSIKRCPECGTCYLWEMEYEYLVGGSEDDITLTRLNDNDAQNLVQKYLQKIKDYEDWFREKAKTQIQILREGDRNRDFASAADFFFYNQMCKGMDISLAIQDMLEALVKHKHPKEGYCAAGSDLYLALADFIKKSEKNKKKILDLLQEVDLKGSPPEVEEIFKKCK
ncbi:MAG: hypothetical protein ACFFCM_20515 [Promethearchaeota archaeon]